MRRLTNTGVNIRPIPPIQCPPWVPLSQLWFHMVSKIHSRKADQAAKPGIATVHG